MNLPANHRRSLSVTANMVDKTLDELEQLFSSAGVSRGILRIKETYSQEERESFLRAMRRMRRANAEMVQDLGLEPSVLLDMQIFRAKTSYLWRVLIDSQSGAMKGFGELPPDAAVAIDQHVARLLDLLKLLEEGQ